MHAAIKGKGLLKSGKSVWLLGCTIPELRAHLQSQFKQGMSWENAGEWEIDHIRPCASFDLSIPEQQQQCFHFSNLQPLWKADNREKRDRYNGDMGTAPGRKLRYSGALMKKSPRRLREEREAPRK
jgi:hypothetical protein